MDGGSCAFPVRNTATGNDYTAPWTTPAEEITHPTSLRPLNLTQPAHRSSTGSRIRSAAQNLYISTLSTSGSSFH